MNEVIKLLLDHNTENDYRQNLEEILSKYFEQNPMTLKDWKAYFNLKD